MAKDAKPRKTTEYVVLAEGPDGGWFEVGETVSASTALEAMKAQVPVGRSDMVRWVAVPARSWKPMQRTVEQVTKETWS